MKKALLGFAAASLLFGPVVASASIIIGAYNFSASGFGPGAPFDPVTGSFAYNFDDAVSTAAPLTADPSSNLSGGNWLSFYDATADSLFLAYVFPDSLILQMQFDQFVHGAAPQIVAPYYAGFGDAPCVRTCVSTVSTLQPVLVPEPAALCLLGIGLGAMAFARRRRKPERR